MPKTMLTHKKIVLRLFLNCKQNLSKISELLKNFFKQSKLFVFSLSLEKKKAHTAVKQNLFIFQEKKEEFTFLLCMFFMITILSPCSFFFFFSLELFQTIENIFLITIDSKESFHCDFPR